MYQATMRRPGGNLSVTEPGKQTVEYDTATCHHCNSIIVMDRTLPPEKLGGMCRQCYGIICEGCVAKGKCRPFEKWLDKVESRDRFLRSVLG